MGNPGVSFPGYCGDETFVNGSQPLIDCKTLKDDIPYCQSRDIKVVLAIGDNYTQAENSTVDLYIAPEADSVQPAQDLYEAFGPYNESSTMPRPFDGPDKHVAVDGFNFHFSYTHGESLKHPSSCLGRESSVRNRNVDSTEELPYIAMVNRLHQLDKKLYINITTECSDYMAIVQDIIHKTAFDALSVNFYDIGSGFESAVQCDIGFWIKEVVRSEKSHKAKVFFGLHAEVANRSHAYASDLWRPQEVEDLVCKYKDNENWGGISLWDLNLASENVIDGKPYRRHVREALDSPCDSLPPAGAPETPQAADVGSISTLPPASAPTSVFESPSPASPISTSTGPVNTSSASPIDMPSASPVDTSVGPVNISSASPVDMSSVRHVNMSASPINTLPPSNASTSVFKSPSLAGSVGTSAAPVESSSAVLDDTAAGLVGASSAGLDGTSPPFNASTSVPKLPSPASAVERSSAGSRGNVLFSSASSNISKSPSPAISVNTSFASLTSPLPPSNTLPSVSNESPSPPSVSSANTLAVSNAMTSVSTQSPSSSFNVTIGASAPSPSTSVGLTSNLTLAASSALTSDSNQSRS